MGCGRGVASVAFFLIHLLFPAMVVVGAPASIKNLFVISQATLEELLQFAQSSPAAPKGKDDDDLLSGSPPKKPATKPAAKDDDLLAPGPAKSIGKPGSKGGDDLLLEQSEKDKKAPVKAPKAEDTTKEAAKEHAKLFVENRFPSSATCATCHPTQYEQWRVSQHAYAQLSPVFNSMQAAILKRTSSTNGDFCVRCHTQIGMILGEPLFIRNADRHPASREGITCIVCHRINKSFGKVSGRLPIVEGDILQPVQGPRGNEELKRVLENRDQYRVVTDPKQQGRRIHTDAEKFFQLTTPGFCGTCHDVNLVNGFRLEEAFSDYKTSPAARNGVSCQDCHMGKVQGKPSGFGHGPAAVVGGVPTRPRKLTNHYFAGPDHSIVHPGIFPFNAKAEEMATIDEWLQFNHKAGWGTDKFENSIPRGYKFPKRWESIDDRYDARKIIEENLKLLDWARERRLEVLRNGFQVGDIKVNRASRDGIEFTVEVKNGTDGHNVPTGFIAERVIFLQVAVTDRDGKVVFKSGDYDPNGDLRDSHSVYVHNGQLPLDKYLFSLQSKFLVRMERGGEREQILAINVSPDPLPYIRPSTNPTVLTGRPTAARIHRFVIEPNGKRFPKYVVDKRDLTGKGPYKASIKLIVGMVPINLIDDIKEVGFDYNMSPREVADRVKEGHLTLSEHQAIIPVSD